MKTGWRVMRCTPRGLRVGVPVTPVGLGRKIPATTSITATVLPTRVTTSSAMFGSMIHSSGPACLLPA